MQEMGVRESEGLVQRYRTLRQHVNTACGDGCKSSRRRNGVTAADNEKLSTS